MSTTIDNRVVEMKFDNKEFEKGVKTTMNSLDELQKKLEFKNVRSGTDELEKGFSSLSGTMSRMENSVSRLSDSFTTLWGTLRRHTIDKIASEIEHGMSRIVKAVSTDGISQGKSKYEQKLNSMRTIMIATSKSAGEVEKVLDELAWYSDQTSYNFSEMTSYIGQFTSVGVELEDAEDAMEGIANACARVGVNTKEAGRAMNEFAQAMSFGYMDRTNFKTLQYMNFADKTFKEEVIKAAIELGKLGKNGELLLNKGVDKGTIVDYQNFSEMLKYGFMDTEVMMKVLRKYGDTTEDFGLQAFKAAQEAKTFSDAIEAIKDAISSGWSNSFELIFGNVEEATKFFTDFCNIIIDDFISPMTEARNALLEGWREGGGRDSMIAALGNVWELIKDIGGIVKNAWTSVFGSMNSDKLVKATNAIRGFIGQVRLWLYTTSSNGKMRITNITNAIRGFLGVLKMAKLVVGGVIHFIGRILGMFMPGFDALGDLLGDTGDSIANFADELEKNGTITNFFDKVADHVKPFIEWIKNLWKSIKESPIFQTIGKWLGDFVKTLPEKWAKVQAFFTDIWNKITSSPIFQNISAKFKEFTAKLPEIWDNIKKWFSTAWTEGGGTIGGFFSTVAKRIGEAIRKFFEDLPNKLKNLKPKIDELGGKIGKWFSEMWAKLTGKASEVGSNATSGFNTAWENIKNWFSDKFKVIGDFFRNLFGGTQKEVAAAVSGGGSSGAASNTLKQEAEKKTGFLGFLEGVKNFFETWFKGFPVRIMIYMGLAAIIFWKIATAIKNVRKSIQAVQKTKLGDSKKGGFFKDMIGIAAALAALAGVIYVINQIKPEDLNKVYIILGGMFGVIILMGAVLGLTKTAEAVGKMFMGIGVAFLGLGIAVALITKALSDITNSTDENFLSGFARISLFIAAIGAVFAGIAILVTRFGGHYGGGLGASFALSLVAMSIAIKLLLPVVDEVSKMPWKKALVGIGGVSLLLGAFGLAMVGLSQLSAGGKTGVVLTSLLGSILLVRTMVYAVRELIALTTDENGNTDWVKAAVGIGGMSVMFIAIGWMFKQIGKVGKLEGKHLATVVLAMVAVLGVCATLIVAITELKDADLWNKISIFGGFAAIFVAMGYMFKQIASIDKLSGGAIVALVGIILVIGAVGALVYMSKDIDWKVLTALMGGMALILLLGGVFAKVVASIPSGISAAKNIILIMGALAVGLVLLGVAVSLIMSLSAGALQDLALAMTTVGYALGIFNDTTGGIQESHMDAMFEILKKFALAFFDMIGIDYSAVSSFVSNTLRLGAVLNRFDKNTASINFNKAEKAFNFINKLKKAANGFAKIKSFNNLTRTITNLGSAIKLYYLSVSGIDTTNAITGEVDVQGITDMIVKLSESLPDDAVFAKIDSNIQSGSLTQLALDITSLGTALGSLSSEVGGANQTSIDYAVDIFTQISKLATAMPQDDEIQTAFGTIHRHYTTLSDFAVDIVALADAINALSTSFGDNAEEGKVNVTAAVSAVQTLADIRTKVVETSLGDNLTAIGDWIHGIAANDAWTNFVSSIGILGGNIKTMAEKVKESGFDKITSGEIIRLRQLMTTVTGMYGEIVSAASRASSGKISIFGGLDNLLTALGNTAQWDAIVKSFPTLASGIVEMAKAAKSQEITDLSPDNINKVAAILSAVSTLYGSVSASASEVNFGEDFGEISEGIIKMAGAVESEDVTKVTEGNLGKVVTILNALSTLYGNVTAPVTDNYSGITSLLTAAAANAAWAGFNEHIPDVAAGVIALSKAIEDESFQGVDENEITRMTSLLNALVGIYNGVTGSITGSTLGLTSLLKAVGANISWSGFVDNIPDAALGIIALAGAAGTESFQELDETEITKMTSLLNNIVDIYNGVTGSITSSTLGLSSILKAVGANISWSGFVDNIPEVAKGIWKLAEVTTSQEFREVNDDDIDNMVAILKPIADLYTRVTGLSVGDGSGLNALLSAIAANTAWTGFISNIEPAAKGMWKLAEAVTSEDFREVKDEDIDTMVKVLGNLADLYTKVVAAGVKVPEGENGFSLLWGALDVWQAKTPSGQAGTEAWTGFVDSFDTIATGMESVAAAASKYNIDKHILDQFLATLDALADTYVTVANGTIKFETNWNGEKYVPARLDENIIANWKTFANNIGVIAGDLAYVFKQILLDDELIGVAEKANSSGVGELFLAFGTMMSSLSGIAMAATFTDDETRYGVLERLMSFIGRASEDGSRKSGLLGFFELLSQIVIPDSSNLTKLATAVGDVNTLIKNINDLDDFNASVNGSDFVAIGSTILQYIAQGMTEESEDSTGITSASKQIINIISSTMNSYAPGQMSLVGRNLDAGLSRGIANYSHLPKDTMRNVMNAVISIARTIPLIKSPSRVMSEIGMYLMAGLGEGMHDEGGKSVDEMEGIMTHLLDVAEWVAPSLADGVLSQKEQFARAMTELGIAGEEALRDTLQIHSISPLFWGIGEWVPVSVARGAKSKPRALTEAGEAIGSLLEKSVRDGVGVFSDGKWLEDFGHMSESEKAAYVEAYPEMMAYLMKQYAKQQRAAGNPFFDFSKAVGVAASQWNSLESALSGFGLDIDLSGLNETQLGTTIAESLGGALGLDDSQVKWLSEKFEGTSAANLVKIFTGGGRNGWDLAGLTGSLKGDSLTNVINALGLDSLGESLLGVGLEDVLNGSVSKVNTPGSGGTGGANGVGGGSGGAYGTNGIVTTPGGLKLTSTDGYTIGDIVNRIDRLENAITSMQIVLDSGVLVGSMGRAMDRQLGDYAMYAGRRN